jgi:hypothetical protein
MAMPDVLHLEKQLTVDKELISELAKEFGAQQPVANQGTHWPEPKRQARRKRSQLLCFQRYQKGNTKVAHSFLPQQKHLPLSACNR